MVALMTWGDAYARPTGPPRVSSTRPAATTRIPR